MFQYLYPYINSRLLAPAYPPQRYGWGVVRLIYEGGGRI
ncbi:putative beta-glucosidase [Trichinella spiralis]|uniref:Beta-glucosidase n=1 Tax=Trichinella spiralis TaxID=6334 RepID=A0ABR3L085_TRISP